MFCKTQLTHIGTHKGHIYLVFKKGKNYHGYWLDKKGNRRHTKIRFSSKENMIEFLKFDIRDKVLYQEN